MIKISCICQKCSQETLCFEDNMGYVTINFKDSCIQFICPKCANVNIIELGSILKMLERNVKLPKIGISKH